MSGEIVYPLGELDQNNWYRNGNYIRPDNYQVPNFCDGCPLAGMCEPRISIVKGLYPVADGTRYIGGGEKIIPDIVVLHDVADFVAEPMYLGAVRFISPFSVEHERSESEILGLTQRRVEACEGPSEIKRWRRDPVSVCASGLSKVTEYRMPGRRPRVTAEDLADPKNEIVGPDTPVKMDEYRRSIAARRVAGQVLQDRPIDLESIQNLMDAALLLTRPERP
jgi:hypothetical protein